jgi:hypothetical protein
MRKFIFPVICFAACLAMLSPNVFAEESQPKEYSEFPVKFDVSAGKEVGIFLEANELLMYSDHFTTQHLGELPDKEEREFTDALALQGDFNFDGFQDIAFFEASGYGGVNQFYRLMLWNNENSEFEPFQTTIGLPSLDKEKQTLVSAQRSGPRWYSTIFTFKNGKVTQRNEEAMIDGLLVNVEIYDANGKRIKRLITSKNDYKLDTPNEKREILLDKAWLYGDADLDTRTKMYVIKGDEVELLDFENEMFLVRYKGKKIIEKWVEAEAVLEW